ncbi:hypothetical protein GCK72_007794 [Caenorhabditis remanei]|uniref:Serpentine Receptor, class T n=1 Tax=Caenorhabditis remanei TaxID=31234 RepID=A0A6A5HK03_CAERE|nr:hypothetical protein GCK72_007794 [Caenorhabditis remanei]KAF1767835.1 hypothetical protein GCK72_007794 [Caenorhabditis remanei]
MVAFISNRFQLNEYYKCPLSAERMDLNGVSWTPIPLYFFGSGIIYMLAYFVCFLAMLQLKRHPSNILMLKLAIYDILQLSVNSTATGFFGFYQIDYCDYPKSIFIAGTIGNGAWLAGAPFAVLVSFERLAEVAGGRMTDVFTKRNFRTLLILLLFWEFYCFFIANPALFNLEANAWFFAPSFAKNPDIYYNPVHSVINYGLPIFLLAINTSLVYFLLFKTNYHISQWLYKKKMQIITQGLVLTIFHASTGIIYEIMQHYAVPSWMFIVGELSWQQSSAMMPVVYLTLNRTIQNQVIYLIIPKHLRFKWGIKNVKEAIAQENNQNAGALYVAPPAPAGGCGAKVGPQPQVSNGIHWD